MKICVCYYPEQWDKSLWESDAKAMVDAGIDCVRIGEFAWSLMEPTQGQFDWAWLDESLDILHAAGLGVILGTPTATPPKWLINQHPDILSYDAQGRPRKFGSRRHYCFSSRTYLRESARIVRAQASRYGNHRAIIGWQTDNEYGCHDTIRSYSPEAELAFRVWLEQTYHNIATLNEAWGTRFWSQIYGSFSEIDLPNLTVTEANPSHVLDFYRFSSDQVVRYNRLQTDILRELSPGRDIYHNFMGHFFDFDHFAVGRDLDVAVWDSYPLGFLDQEAYCAQDKIDFMRQGHPDFAGFHHDLYRACGKGRWGVMEQQPGPVNWAPNNPAPADGMVRLWGHETLAHGGEIFSIFRWRQAPYAQENLHAGMMRPDNMPAPAFAEVKILSQEIKNLCPEEKEFQQPAEIALVFSYETAWMSEIKPQGTQWHYAFMAMEWYSALRKLGQTIDIVAPDADLSRYKLIVIPSLMHVTKDTVTKLTDCGAQILIGPRSGAFTRTMHIPPTLAPDHFQKLVPVKVTRSESFPKTHTENATWQGCDVAIHAWLDHVETELAPEVVTQAGTGLCYKHNNVRLLTGVPNPTFLTLLMETMVREARLDVTLMAKGQRQRTGADHVMTLNYGLDALDDGPDNLLADSLSEPGKLPTGGVRLSKRAR